MKHWPRSSPPLLTGTSAKALMLLSAGNFSNMYKEVKQNYSNDGCQIYILCLVLCQRLGKIMVQATMAVYKDTMDSFLPTPSKSHYIFNLRDFARVIRGVLLAPHTHMQVRVETIVKCLNWLFEIALFLMSLGWFRQDGDKLIRLWIHEVYRVFYDRLIDNEGKETFFGIVKERTSNFFKLSVEKVHI